MIKELTPKEVARKLADEGCFAGLVKDGETQEWRNVEITGVDLEKEKDRFATAKYGVSWNLCAIEIPDPEPVYEPYPDDVCPPLKCGDVIVSKITNAKYLITVIAEENKPEHAYTRDWISNKCLFDNYTYQDGSPIGRKRG